MSIIDATSRSISGFGGILQCLSCAATQPLGNTGHHLANGWPTCCNGHSMRWWTQRQIDAGEMDAHWRA